MEELLITALAILLLLALLSGPVGLVAGLFATREVRQLRREISVLSQ